jgi:hypothetical protein
MLQLSEIQARIGRLQQLGEGLAKEVGLWRGCEDLLLTRERKQYLGGIQHAIAGADAARAALAGAIKRLERADAYRAASRGIVSFSAP